MWHSIFHLQTSLGDKVVRSVLIYLFVVIAFRLGGKRELGQANTLDLVVLLLVANAVQNGIIGNDLSVTGAVLGASVLLILNNVVARLAYWVPWLSRAIEGTPTTLISDYAPSSRALRREQISLPELRAIARRQGFSGLEEVHTAILETNGIVSMLGEDEAKHHSDPQQGGLRIGKRRRAPGG
jgi:uncharacterized membrane protein YcaP (DUF421 family)